MSNQSGSAIIDLSLPAAIELLLCGVVTEIWRKDLRETTSHSLTSKNHFFYVWDMQAKDWQGEISAEKFVIGIPEEFVPKVLTVDGREFPVEKIAEEITAPLLVKRYGFDSFIPLPEE